MRIGIVSLLLIIAAGPAGAQPAPAPAATPAPPPRDAIADLLDRSVPPPKDEDEPDTAGQPRAAAEAEPEASLVPQNPVPQTGPQAGPQPPFAPAPRQQRNAPVRVDETGKTPDSAPTVRDLAYDARIRSSFASAEGFQGPLEGGWTLSTADQALYALQLVDRRDRLEGVWRDLRRRGAIDGSGLVDNMQRQGGELILRFTPQPGAETSVATLHDSGGGVWSGELAEGGRRRSVTLRRTSP